MPPETRYIVTFRDDVKWAENERVSHEFENSLEDDELLKKIESLILKYKPGEPEGEVRCTWGAYNIVYRLNYKDGKSVAMRVAKKGDVKFPEEKLRYEVATMRYIAQNTRIPVPEIYAVGKADENPVGTGPFLIMEYVKHSGYTMTGFLTIPYRKSKKRQVLDPEVEDKDLRKLYRQMADILLQLSELKLPRIGSLVEEGEGEDLFSVSGRPLIQNMNSMLEYTDIPRELLPSHSYYSTSEEWYSAMADMHLAQLTFQHNDAVEDEEDAREKYVARQLFRQLASDGRLTSHMNQNQNEEEEERDTFLLFNSDFRPSNVLIDRYLNVVSVIDWEFTYAAPAQFSYDPPWWLLLREPESYDAGFMKWMADYEPVLDTFLSVMEEEEERRSDLEAHLTALMHITPTLEEDGGYDDDHNQTAAAAADQDAIFLLSPQPGPHIPLSKRMRDSWERKTWMINYAARNSWVFDWLYWKYIDPMFFGDAKGDEDHRARLHLLTPAQREAMEPFVKMKMDESRDRVLVQWKEDDARAHLARFLV